MYPRKHRAESRVVRVSFSFGGIVTAGNMFENVETFNPLAGWCEHECIYCSSHNLRNEYKACARKYTGTYRLHTPALVNLDALANGLPLFVCAQNDIGAPGVPIPLRKLIINYCKLYPNNVYMVQSKNPAGLIEIIEDLKGPDFWLGTTLEGGEAANALSKAPSIEERVMAMRCIAQWRKTYAVIEPIVAFNYKLLKQINKIEPKRIYVGADSKHHSLPEPTDMEISALVRQLKEAGYEVVLKSNLKRLAPSLFINSPSPECKISTESGG